MTNEPDIVPTPVVVDNLQNKAIMIFDLINGTMLCNPDVIQWLDENVGHATSMLWLTYSRGLGTWHMQQSVDKPNYTGGASETKARHVFYFRHAHHAEAFKARWLDIPFWTVEVEYKTMFRYGNRQEPNPGIIELLKKAKQPPTYYLNEYTAEFYLVFFNLEDALMFKLTWINTPLLDFS